MRHAIILVLVLSVGASAQTKKKAETDTLVSRVQYIAKIKADMKRVDDSKKEADQMMLVLQGQLWMLESQTQDSIRVKK